MTALINTSFPGSDVASERVLIQHISDLNVAAPNEAVKAPLLAFAGSATLGAFIHSALWLEIPFSGIDSIEFMFGHFTSPPTATQDARTFGTFLAVPAIDPATTPWNGIFLSRDRSIGALSSTTGLFDQWATTAALNTSVNLGSALVISGARLQAMALAAGRTPNATIPIVAAIASNTGATNAFTRCSVAASIRTRPGMPLRPIASSPDGSSVGRWVLTP